MKGKIRNSPSSGEKKKRKEESRIGTVHVASNHSSLSSIPSFLQCLPVNLCISLANGRFTAVNLPHPPPFYISCRPSFHLTLFLPLPPSLSMDLFPSFSSTVRDLSRLGAFGGQTTTCTRWSSSNDGKRWEASLAVVREEEARLMHTAEPSVNDVALPFFSQPIGRFGCQRTYLNLLFKMVPSNHEESVYIVGTFLREKWRNLTVGYMSMFEVVCKNLHFSRQTVEIVSLSLHHFACRTNRDLKSGIETTPALVSLPQIQW